MCSECEWESLCLEMEIEVYLDALKAIAAGHPDPGALAREAIAVAADGSCKDELSINGGSGPIRKGD